MEEAHERVARTCSLGAGDGDVNEAGVKTVEPVPDELPLEQEQRPRN
jgi:hypothetical protein